MNEYFIESRDILSGHLCDLFNKVFNSGVFPETWARGFIIPLHKKGSVNEWDNTSK